MLGIFAIKISTDLVVVLHQLDDDPDVVAVILDRDHPHDIGRVLRKLWLTHYKKDMTELNTSASGSGQYLLAKTKQASAS